MRRKTFEEKVAELERLRQQARDLINVFNRRQLRRFINRHWKTVAANLGGTQTPEGEGKNK